MLMNEETQATHMGVITNPSPPKIEPQESIDLAMMVAKSVRMTLSFLKFQYGKWNIHPMPASFMKMIPLLVTL